jgi:hypothetical protein
MTACTKCYDAYATKAGREITFWWMTHVRWWQILLDCFWYVPWLFWSVILVGRRPYSLNHLCARRSSHRKLPSLSPASWLHTAPQHHGAALTSRCRAVTSGIYIGLPEPKPKITGTEICGSEFSELRSESIFYYSNFVWPELSDPNNLANPNA